jgi:hypothetical protein
MAPNPRDISVAPNKNPRHSAADPVAGVGKIPEKDTRSDVVTGSKFTLKNHLSSLLLSDDVLATAMEFGTIFGLLTLSYWPGMSAVLDEPGSASFKQITWVFVGKR